MAPGEKVIVTTRRRGIENRYPGEYLRERPGPKGSFHEVKLDDGRVMLARAAQISNA